MITYVIEYLVSGSLNGSTESPLLPFPTIESADSDEDQILQIPVQDLGIINPGTNNQSVYGNRFITWMIVRSPNVGVAGASVDIVDPRTAGVPIQQNITSLVGIAFSYIDSPFLLPQGSAIQIDGMSAAPGQPIIVRLQVMSPETPTEFLEILASLCPAAGELCDAVPQAVDFGGAGSAGTSDLPSRCDHVHPMSEGIPWENVLVAGNTSGGTDAIISNGDRFVFVDGSSTERLVQELHSGINVWHMHAQNDGTATATGDSITIEAGPGGATSGAGGTSILEGGLPVDGNGGPVQVIARNGATVTAANRNGGAVTVTAGNATVAGLGGSITMAAGTGGATGTAGDISIAGGAGGSTSGAGGVFVARGGHGVDGNGGAAAVNGGNGVGTNRDGGAVSSTGGSATGSGTGGNYTVDAGLGGTTGTAGNVVITGGQGGSVSGTGGTATLRGGSSTDGVGGAVVIQGRDGVGTNRGGGAVAISSGTGIGSAAGGLISAASGTGGATGNGGALALSSGAGGGTSGNGGAVSITAGSAGREGDGGSITLTAGNGATIVPAAQDGGNITLTGGNATESGQAGIITLTGGTQPGGAGGNNTIVIDSGPSTGAGTDGNGIVIQGGAVTDGDGNVIAVTASAGVGTNRAGGDISITAGVATGSGTGGDIALTPGNNSAGSGAPGGVAIQGPWQLNSVVTPSALGSGETNDYDPTGQKFANVLQLSGNADGTSALSGIVPYITAGRVLCIENVGAFNITLNHQDASSAAANRFFCPGSVALVIPPNGSRMLRYDGSGWRVYGAVA